MDRPGLHTLGLRFASHLSKPFSLDSRDQLRPACSTMPDQLHQHNQITPGQDTLPLRRQEDNLIVGLYDVRNLSHVDFGVCFLKEF